MQRGALIAGFIATCPMKRIILIVTPSAELGELISTSLRDAREFEGFHFTDPSDAVAFLAARRDCEAAIIETRIGEARTIDEAAHPDVAGTVAGDDTIFIAARDSVSGASLRDELTHMTMEGAA